MKELVRANDPALLSYVQSLLSEANIDFLLADQHMSIMDGSIGALPRRILVPEDEFDRARQVMRDAGLADEISRTHNRD
ncbi:MAG: DUF2007 domain-containing protein [Oricola sp.]|jgi:hypothetical protein|nr:DUF2007 domain-containing protein [Oricola sp.]